MAGIDPIAEAVKQRASGLYDDEHPVIHREPGTGEKATFFKNFVEKNVIFITLVVTIG